MTNIDTVAAVRYLSPARVCEKFSRKRTWLYEQSRNDPTFPKFLRLGKGPVWREHELDEWIVAHSAALVAAAMPRKRGRPFKVKSNVGPDSCLK